VRLGALAALVLALVGTISAATAAPPKVPSFDHVVVIVFENKERERILRNPKAPTFDLYAKRFANLTAYYAVTHPSLPNYIALVSGSTLGIRTDCTTCVFDSRSLADSLESAGRSWKTYAEELPYAGFTGAVSGEYAKKHDPFLYFRDIVADHARRLRIVPLERLTKDLRTHTLPDFALIVPDMCSSMHDCGIGVGDAWLRRVAAPLLKLPRTAIFVVFDEGSTSLRGGGHTAALVLGTAVRSASRYSALSGHYAVLRTIEDAWHLPRLGASKRARPITGIWR
jgi:hypothetical protein